MSIKRKIGFITGFIILSFGIYLIYPVKHPHFIELVDQWLVPYPNDFLKIPENRAARTIDEQAFIMYNQNRFDQANILFNEVLKQEPPQLDILFFKANALFALQQWQASIAHLNLVQPNSRYYFPAQWLKVLILLKQGKIPDALDNLEKYLAAGTSYKQEEAKKLFKIIKES